MFHAQNSSENCIAQANLYSDILGKFSNNDSNNFLHRFTSTMDEHCRGAGVVRKFYPTELRTRDRMQRPIQSLDHQHRHSRGFSANTHNRTNWLWRDLNLRLNLRKIQGINYGR